MLRRGLAAAVGWTLLPGSAEACTWCISSAFGDRTFNWPYLGLILAPFVVAGTIGGVLAYFHRVARVHADAGDRAPIEETT